MGTRSEETMVKWASGQYTGTLRSCRAEAERDGDRALVLVIDAELRRRGYA